MARSLSIQFWYRRPTWPIARQLPYLLHGKETRVWGDQGYHGRTHLIHKHAPHARDFTNRRYRFNGQINAVDKAKNRNKSRVRAKVEHVFGVIKNIFGFRQTRYRGLAKICTGSKSLRR